MLAKVAIAACRESPGRNSGDNALVASITFGVLMMPNGVSTSAMLP